MKIREWWHHRWCFDCRDYDGVLAYAKAGAPKGHEERWVYHMMRTWAADANCKRRLNQ